MNILKMIGKQIIGLGFIAICLLQTTVCDGQPEVFEKKNAFYVEALGNARLVSANYERIFNQSGNMKTAIRLGYGFWKVQYGGENFNNSMLPLELNSLIGNKQHHLEIGFGTTVNFEKIRPMFYSGFGEVHTVSYLSYHGRIGYRYQKPTGGLLFRASFTPFYSRDYSFTTGKNDYEKRFYPWVGLSVGYAF